MNIARFEPWTFVDLLHRDLDRLVGARNVIVVMMHNASDGAPKLVSECTLPLTTLRPVDWVVTELATFRMTPEGLKLFELAPGVNEEALRRRTSARYLTG